MVQERIKFRQACGNDINKYCPGVAPGSGRIAICLTEHDKDLSASCSEILKSMKLPKE